MDVIGRVVEVRGEAEEGFPLAIFPPGHGGVLIAQSAGHGLGIEATGQAEGDDSRGVEVGEVAWEDALVTERFELLDEKLT